MLCRICIFKENQKKQGCCFAVRRNQKWQKELLLSAENLEAAAVLSEKKSPGNWELPITILNTKSGLGVSPIISVAYSISTIWNLNFGDTTFALYAIFVMIEMLLHENTLLIELRPLQAI